jgi:flagellar basal body P-ring formation protein FlgA
VAEIAAPPALVPAETGPVRTLREMLVADLAGRLNLPAESLQVDFKPQDQNALNISTPLFSFEIEPLRARSLGQVVWNVKIRAPAGQENRKLTISADARAWQDQVVATRPLTFKQIIREVDVIRRRALVDQLGDDPLLTIDQVVGQQAARELKPGMVMTAKTIDAVQLVKAGQFVTVTLDQGSVKIKTVAKALENGVYGQTIRVKNEATRDVYQVVLTGPQQATMNLAAPLASVESQN